MSIESAKSLLQSGFGIWLASFAGVAVAVVVCMTWLDRPIAPLAYEWLGRHRAVQHFAETPGFFGPLVVLAFAVLLLRSILTRRFGTMDRRHPMHHHARHRGAPQGLAEIYFRPDVAGLWAPFLHF